MDDSYTHRCGHVLKFKLLATSWYQSEYGKADELHDWIQAQGSLAISEEQQKKLCIRPETHLITNNSIVSVPEATSCPTTGVRID